MSYSGVSAYFSPAVVSYPIAGAVAQPTVYLDPAGDSACSWPFPSPTASLDPTTHTAPEKNNVKSTCINDHIIAVELTREQT